MLSALPGGALGGWANGVFTWEGRADKEVLPGVITGLMEGVPAECRDRECARTEGNLSSQQKWENPYHSSTGTELLFVKRLEAEAGPLSLESDKC